MKSLKDLTPDEKRIIVAEWLGGTVSHESVTWPVALLEFVKRFTVHLGYVDKTHQSFVTPLPEFSNDQNAIIAACGKLDGEQKDVYYLNLFAVFHLSNIPVSTFTSINATASQRTDALVLTIGKATL